MKRTIAALALVAAFICAAQDKVAYVNMEKAFTEYYRTVNANVTFEQKKADYEMKMSILAKELESSKKELNDLDREANNDLLAKEARDEAGRKFKIRKEVFDGKLEEFDRARRAGVQDLTQTKAESEEGLVRELVAAIRQFAADKGYTHVYDVSGMSMNRMPVLLVYPEQQDVTAAFIAVINSGHEKEGSDAREKLEELSRKADAARNAE